MSGDGVEGLEERLGYRFREPERLWTALTHPSYAHVLVQRGEQVADNQRLEFLGDAVIELCVSERLVADDQKAAEGTLTQRRAWLVNERHLALAARKLDLGGAMRLGVGEEREGFRARAGVLADAYEAVVAAIYLDGGMEAARAFLLRTMPALAEGEARLLKPPKAALQEETQRRWKETPRYRVVSRRDGGEVVAEVVVGTRLQASGVGRSKKEAERAAAEAALALLEG